ncbi:MAG: hypothetical protein Q8L37_05515 [Candidatus Gottesmanbacteria bacterium]|nr:hypothetical protein [Candidatus Gottesmanbacteria bacterium]
MNNLLNSLLHKINLIGTTATEQQALNILVLIKNEFKNNKYQFNGSDLTSLQLGAIFNNQSWKQKTIVDFYGKEFHSIWQVINYLCDKGYVSKELNTSYYITTNGKIKVNELESINFATSKIINFIGILGGLIYFINQLMTLYSSYAGSLIQGTK